MTQRLYRFRIEFDFIVVAENQDDATSFAEEMIDVIELPCSSGSTRPHCRGEVTGPLSKQEQNVIPYGSDVLTCKEILEQDDE